MVVSGGCCVRLLSLIKRSPFVVSLFGPVEFSCVLCCRVGAGVSRAVCEFLGYGKLLCSEPFCCCLVSSLQRNCNWTGGLFCLEQTLFIYTGKHQINLDAPCALSLANYKGRDLITINFPVQPLLLADGRVL